MGKGLLEKAGRIQLPTARPAAEAAPAAPPVAPVQPMQAAPSAPVGAAKPRTAPGTLMGFMATQSEAIRDNERLREQLTQFEGAKPARLTDAKLIRACKRDHRHSAAFERHFQSFA